MTQTEKVLNIVRLALGWIFLWAFLDKLFGLGFATQMNQGWLDGVSPTTGFLAFGTKGALAETYKSLSGTVVIDWLYMLGLAFAGISLTFGIAVRLASIVGSLMMLIIYTAVSLPPLHNPIIDEHIVYVLVLIALYTMPSTGMWLGLGKRWRNIQIVRAYPVLQ